MTDLIIEAAAMQQRTEIEEQLFKLRLKQKCFVALATRAPGALEVRSDFPVDGSDQAGFRSPECRVPLGFYSGTPGSGVHVASPAVTQPQDAMPAEDSDQGQHSEMTVPSRGFVDPAVTSPPVSFDAHNPYPKGRW